MIRDKPFDCATSSIPLESLPQTGFCPFSLFSRFLKCGLLLQMTTLTSRAADVHRLQVEEAACASPALELGSLKLRKLSEVELEL